MKYLSILLIFFLTSCGKFKDGTSVWGDWLFFIPWGLGIGAALCWIAVYRSYKSGTRHQSQVGDGGAGGWKDDKGKKASTGYLVFAIALTVILIGVLIYQNTQK